MNKMAKFICKHKLLILIIAILLCIPAIIGYLNTKINYDILVYLPKDIETLKGQKILTDDFEMGAFSMVVVDNMSQKDILDLEDKFRNINSVEHVLSISDITGTTIPINMLPTKVVKKFTKGTSQLMLVTFKNSTSDDETLAAVSEMRKITDDKVKIGGMSAMVLDTKELFNKEMLLYVIIAVILCIIVLELFLDSYIIPILLMINIGIAILFNMGSNIILGDISYITKAIAAVLQLGVTTDFSIFLYHKYESLKKESKNKNDAMAIAIHDTFISVFGSSLTTIAGFLALCTMNLTLGSDIGLVMAKGVLIGVICVLTLFPALLLVFDKQIEKTTHKVLTPKFTRTKNFVMKHYKIIFICFIILLIPAYYFQSKTNVYYKLDESIPDDYGYSIATKTLKNDYNMVSQSIVLVDRNKKDFEINNMIDEIEKIDGINKVISATELSNLGITDNVVNENIKKIYETDKYKMILITSNYDIATNELNDQVDKIDKVIKKYDSNAILAGEGPLMKDLVVISDQDFRNVNFTSIAVIFIIMLIVLKSVSLPVLLVTAIEFAIFINMGVPYISNTTLPFIASVVIGTIQLGATIDYAILLTTKYLDERKTKDKFESVRSALDSSVSSIFVSAMCFFAATIGVGLVSKIDMIGSLCKLMSRGAIISMFVVILIVPSILLIFDKLIIKTTYCFRKKEGKNMKKKIITAILLISLFTPFNALAASKNETVYSVIGSDGNTETTVTDILEGFENDIIDESDLENILNINGDEKYFKEDNKLTWKSNGNTIYYQGTTKKKLPIDIKVTYYLNDKETNVKSLNGKSGHIKMRIDYNNNEKHGDLYTPFIVTMGTIIKGNIKNATISNGKILTNGMQSIVVGIALPNLSDSLGIKELDNFNYLTIEYDTTSFEESDIYNVYSSNLLSSSDLNVFNKLDAIYSKVNTLNDSSTKLVQGSKRLQLGINEYTNNFKTYKTGVKELNKGTKTLNLSYKKINNGITTINSSISQLTSLTNSLDELKNGLTTIATKIGDSKTDGTLLNGLSNIKNALNSISKELETVNTNEQNILKIVEAYHTAGVIVDDGVNNYYSKLIKMLNANIAITNSKVGIIPGTTKPNISYITNSMNDGINQMTFGLKQIKSALNEMNSSLDTKTMNEKFASLTNGLSALKEGSTKFNNGLDSLSYSTNKIDGATNQLYNATNKINDGVAELSNGIEKFDNEGIKKIVSYINGDVKNLENKLKRLQKLGDEYDTFTKKKSNINGETKFIVKIEA